MKRKKKKLPEEKAREIQIYHIGDGCCIDAHSQQWCFCSMTNTKIPFAFKSEPRCILVKADSGNYQVLDEQGNVVQSVTQGKSVELQPGQRFSSVNGFDVFYEDKSYRGDAYWIDGNMVNILSMEQYLYSVVMREIGGYAPSFGNFKGSSGSIKVLCL